MLNPLTRSATRTHRLVNSPVPVLRLKQSRLYRITDGNKNHHLTHPRTIFTTTTNTANNTTKMSFPPLTSATTTITLPSGYSMPILGYGVYQTPRDICQHVVNHALTVAGYRHIDSAQAYRNEAASAQAIIEAGQKSENPISRSSIFFTSKISTRNMGYEKSRDSIDETLRVTGLDYLDLMLIHAPYGGTEARNGSWRALVEAQKAGKIRSIGVSNYGVHHLDELQSYIDSSSGPGGTIDVGQWELHPWLPRSDIVKWARDHNVVIQAWSPLVRGTRADDETLTRIAKKHNKTWAQVLIRWSLQQGYVPLAKSVTEKRIVGNVDVFGDGFELDKEDMQDLEFPGSYVPCSWDPTVSGLDE